MSTVVAVKKEDLIAIGADTLTKLGTMKESAAYVATASKIVRVGENYLAYVGHASLGLVLTSYFANLEKPPRLDSAQAIFEAARKLHRTLKEEYFLVPTEHEDDEFESSRLDCLIANPSGIYGLYALRSVQEYTKFYSFGTGATFALGAMYAVYDLPSMTAPEIARIGLAAAAEFDDSTGGPMEIYTMTYRKYAVDN
ncbi:MAG: hypothetical protein ACUVRM_04310 [Bacillota bacterium]